MFGTVGRRHQYLGTYAMQRSLWSGRVLFVRQLTALVGW